MKWNFLRWHSLRTRLTLITLAIFVIGIWTLVFFASRLLREDVQRLMGDQQFSTVSFVAASINDELQSRVRGLETLARGIDSAMMADPPALQRLIASKPVLLNYFNAGIHIVGPDGIALADVSEARRVGASFGDVEPVRAVLSGTGAVVIGEPLMGPRLRQPVFPIVVAIRDGGGRVLGALIGTTTLSKSNFLDKVTEGKYGRTGGYMLVSKRSRQVVTSTNKAHIMQALPAPGANPMIDRFMQGGEGSAVGINPFGVEVLASAKGIPAAQWYVAIALPTQEAFEPIRELEGRLFAAAVALTLLAGVLTRWMLKRQLSPMLDAARKVAALSDSGRAPPPVGRQDEIGYLIGGFNRLLESLTHPAALGGRDASGFQLMADNAPVLIWAAGPDCRYEYFNKMWLGFTGRRLEQELGDGWIEGVHPDDVLACRAVSSEAFSARREFEREYRLRRHDGEYRWISDQGVPRYGEHGAFLGFIGSGIDITGRKNAEQALAASETRLRAVLDGVGNGVITIDEHGAIESFNKSAERMFGYAAEEVLGRNVNVLMPAPHQARHDSYLAAYRRTGVKKIIDRKVDVLGRRRDGSQLHIELNVCEILLGGRRVFIGSLSDISFRKQAEAELRIAATAFETQEGMVVTDPHGVILRINRAFAESTGYRAEEAIGKTPRLLKSGRHDSAFYAEMWRQLLETGAWQGEIWDRRKNGQVYPKWLAISAVRAEDGSVTHYVGMHHDITERKIAEEKIKELAFFDPLTRLPNRTLLMDRLKQTMTVSARGGGCGALLFIDLDNFKTLNDTLGHDQGDLLLQQVAQRLGASVREGDTVARVGGDEFVVVLGGLDHNLDEAASQTRLVGEKILAALGGAYFLRDSEYRSSASIGATLFQGQQTLIDELLKQADLAMYKAKESGRNALRFFDPAMQVAVVERAGLEAGLRKAVESNQLLLHFQPQVVGNGRVIGAEALVRWMHPQRGMVPPAEFIPLAEETGAILPLGAWVLETACAQLARWHGQPGLGDLSLAINVSPQQFREPDFASKVLAVIDRSGANPYRLKVELTETLLVSNIEDIIEKMFELKARGIGFALDDFGTGYSSLSYLKRLPLDQLKIDRSFVRDVLVDPNDAAIARTIVALAQSLGLGVIAEGVESEPQREFLARQGCHAYQGYLFSRPLPLEEFERFVRERCAA